jgi:SAM-dependent methyltransferase
VVADIGSGTGILTELLLARGALLIGVEPNEGMRAAAEARLGGQARFRSVNGTAEATTLPAASVDLLVVGQAFHWFDGEKARREALRVLKPHHFAALLWNERPQELTPFLADYEALLRRHAPEYVEIVARRADVPSMRRFFGGAMELETFPNQQTFDFDGLVGRLRSTSYAPEPGDAHYHPLMAGLRAVFDRHEQAGRVVFPYRTLVYFGPAPPGPRPPDRPQAVRLYCGTRLFNSSSSSRNCRSCSSSRSSRASVSAAMPDETTGGDSAGGGVSGSGPLNSCA